jgi:hypothetical protein
MPTAQLVRIRECFHAEYRHRRAVGEPVAFGECVQPLEDRARMPSSRRIGIDASRMRYSIDASDLSCEGSLAVIRGGRRRRCRLDETLGQPEKILRKHSPHRREISILYGSRSEATVVSAHQTIKV